MSVNLHELDIALLMFYNEAMLNTIPARDIQRSYRQVFDKVNKTGQPVIVISNNKPLGVIITVEQYEATRPLGGYKNVSVDTAGTASTLNQLQGSISGLSSDLSEKHDDILWNK